MIRFLCVVLLLLGLVSGPALAQTTTWDGSTDVWSNNVRWDNGLPNAASFDAVINGGNVNFDLGATTLGSLSVTSATLTGSGGPLTIVNTLALSTGQLQATTVVTVQGTFNFNGGSTLGDGSAGSGNVIVDAAGTLNLNNDTANLTFNNGASLTNNGTGNWVGSQTMVFGQGNPGGAVTFTNNGSLTASGNATISNVDAGSHVFTNAGTFTKDTSFGTTTIGVTFDNTGTVNVNSGTLALTNGGTHTGDFNIGNSTSLQLNGVHNFQAGSSVTGLGGVDFAVGVATFAAGSSYTATGLLSISGGDAVFNVDVTANALTLTNGSLRGTGTITANGTVTLNSGTLGDGTAGNGTLVATSTFTLEILTLNNGASLTNSGTGTWNSGNFITFGQGNGGGAATFTNTNTGTLTATSDGTFGTSDAGAHTFNNAGTFIKNGGAGNTTIDVIFNNTGSVQVNTGTLILSRGGTHTGSFSISNGTFLTFFTGTHTLQSGASVSGGGAVNFSAGTTTFEAGSTFSATGPVTVSGGTANFSIDLSFGDFTMTGGTLAGSGNVFAAGTVLITGGTLGDGTAAGNGILIIEPGAGLDLSMLTFNNGAVLSNDSNTATWSDSNTLTFGQGNAGGLASFTNFATLTATGNGTFAASDADAHAFTNSGTFIKDGGAFTTTIDITFGNSGAVQVDTGTLALSGGGSHTGSFTVAAGTTLSLSGTHTFDVGSSFAGAGTVSLLGGTTVANTALNIPGTFNLNGGSLQGPAAVTVLSGGTFDLLSGTLGNGTAGDGILAAAVGSTFNLSQLTLNNGASLTNNSANGTWSDSNFITFGQGNAGGAATFTNNGTLSATGGGTFSVSDGDAHTFSNPGTFTKSAGGTTTIGVIFNNTGTVNVDIATLLLTNGGTSTGSFNVAAGSNLDFNGGTHTLNPGASFTGTGTVSILSGSLVANTNLSLAGELTINGGSLQGPNLVTVNTGGTLNLTNGTLGNGTVGDGNLTAAAGSTLNLGTFTFNNGSTFTNGGSGTWSPGLIVSFGGVGGAAVSFNNAAGATLNALGDGQFIDNDGAGHQFNNAGTFTKSGGITNTVIGIQFNNTGTVQVQSGTIFFGGGFLQSAATAEIVLNGGNINTGGTTFEITDGTLRGNGTIIGNVTASGNGVDFSPGLSPGEIDIDGNLLLGGASTYNVELGGTTRGSTYDASDVTGAADISTATLNVSFFGGFEAGLQDSDVFVILTANGGLIGTFVNAPDGTLLATTDGFSDFFVYYIGNDVILTRTPIPEPSTWALLIVVVLGGVALRRRYALSR